MIDEKVKVHRDHHTLAKLPSIKKEVDRKRPH
jgi:hypothetical protein